MRFAELDGQHVELLPARTVLSMFSAGDAGTAVGGDGSDSFGGFGFGFLNRTWSIGAIPGLPGANATG